MTPALTAGADTGLQRFGARRITVRAGYFGRGVIPI